MARSGSFMSTGQSINHPPGPSLRPGRPHNLAVKRAGTRRAGNPHAACAVAGTGNGTSGLPAGHRASSRPYQGAGGSNCEISCSLAPAHASYPFPCLDTERHYATHHFPRSLIREGYRNRKTLHVSDSLAEVVIVPDLGGQVIQLRS